MYPMWQLDPSLDYPLPQRMKQHSLRRTKGYEGDPMRLAAAQRESTTARNHILTKKIFKEGQNIAAYVSLTASSSHNQDKSIK